MHIKGIRKYPKLYFFEKSTTKNVCIIVFTRIGGKNGAGGFRVISRRPWEINRCLLVLPPRHLLGLL